MNKVIGKFVILPTKNPKTPQNQKHTPQIPSTKTIIMESDGKSIRRSSRKGSGGEEEEVGSYHCRNLKCRIKKYQIRRGHFEKHLFAEPSLHASLQEPGFDPCSLCPMQ